MSYLIFICSVGLIYFIYYAAKSVTKNNISLPNYKPRFYLLLQFAKIAPALAFTVLLILSLALFHTKIGIRLSHAWYDAQFWAFATFLYCCFSIGKNKILLIPMSISMVIAVYNTPLFHYQHLFNGNSIVFTNILGTLMFLGLWVVSSKMLVKMKG